jgi:hypothetical protein
MANDAPVVFLAFANAPNAHLENLKTESRHVYRTLQPLQDEGQIHVHREESSEIGELYEDLLRHDGRIVIFHYGGHADGNTLRLEGGDGGGKGLADLLGQQSGLKLVFLNGCATKGHVKRLLGAGVPAVIATSVPIGDVKAQEFANAFYIALAEGRSVAGAFDSGSAFVQGKHGGDEGVVFTRSGTDWEDEEEEEYDAPVLEWGLYVQESCADDLEQWRLPQAQSAWEALLIDTDGPLRTMDGSPCLLKYQAPSRTLSASVCANCGATVTAAAETTSCAICGSNDVQGASVPTKVTDQVVPFSVSEDDARSQILEYAGGESKVIQINRIFVPYWIFDLATRTTFEAERGVNRDFTAIPPKLEWEPVKDEIDLAFNAFLVPASSVPVGRDSTAQNWYWELDQAEPLDQIDTGTASIPLDRSMQSAFDQIASKQQRQLEHEITDRVGGNQQRNVSTDTRYRNVAARTILLPHWYATVEVEKGHAGLLVNGQIGAVRPLHLPGAVSLKNGSSTSMNKRTYEPGDKPAETSLAASVFSGAGIGLMVGAMLGLAMSPTVATFVGAIGAALAALLGLNDRHFSVNKGVRIGAFGVFALVGAAAGLYAKEYSVFAPSLVHQKEQIKAAGFSECQSLDLLAGLSLRVLPPENTSGLAKRKKEFKSVGFSECQALSLLVGRAAAAAATGKEAGGDISGRQLSPVLKSLGPVGLWAGNIETDDACRALNGIPYPAVSPLTDLHDSFYKAGPGWKSYANSVIGTDLVEQEKVELLFITRDAVCDGRELPTALQCKRLLVAAQSGTALRTAFGKFEILKPVLLLVDQKIASPSDRTLALRQVTGALCKSP